MYACGPWQSLKSPWILLHEYSGKPAKHVVSQKEHLARVLICNYDLHESDLVATLLFFRLSPQFLEHSVAFVAVVTNVLIITAIVIIMNNLYNANTTQPSYLYGLVSIQPPHGHNTRSSPYVTLIKPSSSLKVTHRSFRHALPHLWNQLPASLRILWGCSITSMALT